jgi:hypothetical protein
MQSALTCSKVKKKKILLAAYILENKPGVIKQNTLAELGIFKNCTEYIC